MVSGKAGPFGETRPTVAGIDHVALVVTDVEASKRWYREIFGFEPLKDVNPGSGATYIGNEHTRLALLQTSEGSRFTPAVNQGARACHFAFGVDGATFEAYERGLAGLGVTYEKLTHAESQSLYFSDPDGYVVEATTYDLS